VTPPRGDSIAIVGVRNGKSTVSVFDYGVDPIHRHYDCSIDTLAKFAPDGSWLLVLQSSHYKADISLIRMSRRPIKRILIANPKRWELSSFKLFKMITLDHRSFFKALLEVRYGTTVCLFVCLDGRMVLCPALHKQGDMVYYGNRQLPITQLSRTSLCDLSERDLAYVNEQGQVVVINYSRYIDQMYVFYFSPRFTVSILSLVAQSQILSRLRRFGRANG
jgi:hypothetical protein